MDREELLAGLKLCNTGDEETDHLDADELLLNYIDEIDVSDAFDAINKWYA